jgi:nucleotide-binding universal stress UspA family protein
MVEINKILFPVDLTEDSSKILPYVLSASEKYNSKIYLFHVAEDVHTWGAFEVPAAYGEEEVLDAARKEMDRVCEEQLQGCPNFQKKTVLGNPTIEILKAIKAEDIDLVIMGTHGRKGISRTVFGSVAESIVKSSPVPVLTVNPGKLNSPP